MCARPRALGIREGKRRVQVESPSKLRRLFCCVHLRERGVNMRLFRESPRRWFHSRAPRRMWARSSFYWLLYSVAFGRISAWRLGRIGSALARSLRTHTCSVPPSCSSCSPTAPPHSSRRHLDSSGRTWQHTNPMRRRLARAHALKAHACNRVMGGKRSRAETPGETLLERLGRRVTTRISPRIAALSHALKAHACNRVVGGKRSRAETPGGTSLERLGRRVTTRISPRIAALAGPPQNQLLAAPAGSPKAAAVDPPATGSATMTAATHLTVASLTVARLTVARLAVARLTAAVVSLTAAVVSLTAAVAVARTFERGGLLGATTDCLHGWLPRTLCFRV